MLTTIASMSYDCGCIVVFFKIVFVFISFYYISIPNKYLILYQIHILFISHTTIRFPFLVQIVTQNAYIFHDD